MTSSPPKSAITITIIILLIVCVVCVCLLGITGAAILLRSSVQDQLPTYVIPSASPTPAPWPTPVTGTEGEGLSPEAIKMAQETLGTLNEMVVPINDPIELADRLGGKKDVPSTYPDPDAPYSEGARKTFWVTNTETNKNFQVTAVLRYVGDNIYFWIEDGVSYKDSDLRKLGDEFDQQIIPTNREFFGDEWNPGVDDDPRLYVLYAGGLGYSIAGYFSSADELHPDAHQYSNAHEMFLINSDTVGLGESYIYGTMAHEFQHMIHWYQDKNEETWVNEGFSMLAEHINELDAGGFDWEYMNNPDLRLTDWGGDTGLNGPHYGASYLFMVYFLDRFGEDATKALVAHDENGFAAIDKVMVELGIRNPSTGQYYTGNEFFTDWSIANFLQKSGIDDRRYDYVSYTPYKMNPSQVVSTCPTTVQRDVFQYGVNYIEIDCEGDHTLSFTGTEAVKLLPFEETPSGSYYFWSNMGDESNPSLTQTFDLTNVTGPASLDFKVWYDLETDYDYVFASASTDGETWSILRSRTCTTDNPSGNSYGCGWNGQTNGWIDERLDLSDYAGEKVTVRIDYVTDAAVNGKGLTLDDFRLDAIGYSSDLEADQGGWIAEGFVRVQNVLPQTYQLSLITIGKETKVHTIPLNAQNQAQVPISIGGNVDKVIVVVSGSTPVTREKAVYQLTIQ